MLPEPAPDVAIRPLDPRDWPAVRNIYLEGLGRMHGRWRDVLLLERRSTAVG